jgi:hypothetical protein
MTFLSRLTQLCQDKQTDVALLLRPQMAKLPLPIQRFDDPFLPFSRAILDAAQPHVACVLFDVAAYLALGAAGAVALERAIAYAGSRGDLLTIMHVPFATPDYAAATSALAFAPDGVTVTVASLIPAYVLRHQAGVFVMSSQEAADFSVYDTFRRELRVSWQGLRLRLIVAGDDVVYAGMDEGFAQAATDRLKALQRVSR